MQHQTRRAFLKNATRFGLASVAARVAVQSARAVEPSDASPRPAAGLNSGPIPEADKSIVCHIRREEVVDRQSIHDVLLEEMIGDGLITATSSKNPDEAWNRLLKSDDVIGIKFNQVGAKELATTEAMATCLVRSLSHAGFDPQRIMLIEAPAPLAETLKTRPRPFGFSGQEVDFGTGAEELAAVLQEVTALINVPFLKTHNIAGVTGCLKNLSHALIRRPGRYHGQACAPYVANIVALPQIRSKLRVHIVNAVRAVYDRGPAVAPGCVWNHAGLIVSTDPVAADAVGIDILNEQRIRSQLPPVGDRMGHVPHIHEAARAGLGTDDQDYIKLEQTDAGA